MKSKLILIILAFIFFPLSAALFTNTTTLGAVTGKIEGLQIESGVYYLQGWVCQKNSPTPLQVHVYAGGAYGKGGTHVVSATSSYAAETEVTETCSSSAAAKHRFKIKLSDSALEKYAGKAIYVHGISLIANSVNPTIANSGTYRFPNSLTKAPMGCMQSSMAVKDTRNVYVTEYNQAQGSGWIYAAWVWRETPDASTNNNISVARTQDMVNWYNTCGEKLNLPITSDSRAVIDPITPKNGLMNNMKLGFDAKGLPVVTFQKNIYKLSATTPAVIATQIFNARLEDSGWKLHQVTNWTTKTDQEGGGSLASTPKAPGYGAISVDRNGVMYQTLNRPTGDSTGSPGRGTWIITEKNGLLQVPSTAYDAKTAPADTFNPTSGIGAFSTSLEMRASDWKTAFSTKTIRTDNEERWHMLRGDWDGDGVNGPGLFDRRTRKFVIRDGAQDKIFLFGPGSIPLYPLVADWNNDGLDTIGVYDSVSKKYYAKNSLAGGNGDPVGTTFSNLKIKDGIVPRWYSVNPYSTHAITYETLPANNDLPYSCDGTAYTENTAATWAASKDILATCPERFLSNLNLHTYNVTTKKWTTTLIDRAWGIGGAFALKVFKGHQVIAYYDSNRNVKVAIRKDNGTITYQVLDDVYGGWDSHNYLRLTIDENHNIHLAGDQHVNPMNYWRSNGLTTTFKRYAQTGTAEKEVTYPSFFRHPDGDLLFQYRDGSSGDGEWIINRYDIRKGTWKRMLNTSLFGRE